MLSLPKLLVIFLCAIIYALSGINHALLAQSVIYGDFPEESRKGSSSYFDDKSNFPAEPGAKIYSNQPARRTLRNPPPPKIYLQTEVVIFDQTPMRNIFLNTIWGSITGSLLGVSVAALEESVDKKTRLSTGNLVNRIFIGAATGAIISFVISNLIFIDNTQFPNPDFIDRLSWSDNYNPIHNDDSVELYSARYEF
ncbi:MAG: hypothetical protein JJV97_06370 [SAR324 cluster bacterium]|nr:hypothetical protein [SAR324 cluster bacterium]